MLIGGAAWAFTRKPTENVVETEEVKKWRKVQLFMKSIVRVRFLASQFHNFWSFLSSMGNESID